MSSVAIVGQGFSIQNYWNSADEVWTLNALNWISDGVFKNRTLCFWMDDFDYWIDMGERAKANMELIEKFGNSNGQVITSRKDNRWPWVVEYPLAEVINYWQCDWFNNSVPYMIAMAGMQGKDIHCHGLDYKSKEEQRRYEGECTTYWIAMARARGIVVKINPASFLLQSNYELINGKKQGLYGYKYLDYERKLV